jgi:hypothetical protein
MAITMMVILCTNSMGQGDSLSQIKLLPQKDSLLTDSSSTHLDSSLSDSSVAQSDSTSAGSTSPSKQKILTAQWASDLDTTGLSNIVVTTKGIRARGWGEYKVGGRCLCCDNLLDGDCIIVQNTNRTEQVKLKQVVDGIIDIDTSSAETYFGDVTERERPEFVSLLMVEVTLKKAQDIYGVIVYTMVDGEKKRNYLSNCELGYYDQFDRLQWAGKVENKKFENHITFKLDKPFLSKTVVLRVKGGKNRITEVAIYCKKSE